MNVQAAQAPTFAELFTPKTVAIVALPLSMAIAIAPGVTTERGHYTAIVGGFLVSLLGGSRFQIGGPAGAFIVLVAAPRAANVQLACLAGVLALVAWNMIGKHAIAQIVSASRGDALVMATTVRKAEKKGTRIAIAGASVQARRIFIAYRVKPPRVVFAADVAEAQAAFDDGVPA